MVESLDLCKYSMNIEILLCGIFAIKPEVEVYRTKHFETFGIETFIGSDYYSDDSVHLIKHLGRHEDTMITSVRKIMYASHMADAGYLEITM